MLTTNIKDYSEEYLNNDLKRLTAQDFITRASYFHCYVFVDDTVMMAILLSKFVIKVS